MTLGSVRELTIGLLVETSEDRREVFLDPVVIYEIMEGVNMPPLESWIRLDLLHVLVNQLRGHNTVFVDESMMHGLPVVSVSLAEHILVCACGVRAAERTILVLHETGESVKHMLRTGVKRGEILNVYVVFVLCDLLDDRVNHAGVKESAQGDQAFDDLLSLGVTGLEQGVGLGLVEVLVAHIVWKV
jgi:hypothetical protein